MRRTRVLAAALAFGAMTTSARAAEVVLGAQSTVAYDDNVFRSSTATEDDGSIRFGPSIRLRENRSTLTYDLLYQPAYKQFFDLRGISTFEHVANGKLNWKPSSRTEFSFSEVYYMLPTTQLQNFAISQTNDLTGLLESSDPIVTQGRRDVQNNALSLSGAYLFTPRLRGELRLDQTLFDEEAVENPYGGIVDAFGTPTPNRIGALESGSYSIDGSMLYSLTRATRLGGGVNATYQSFQQYDVSAERAQYYQTYGMLVHDFDPTWNLTISAGPAFTRASEASSPSEVRTAVIPVVQLGSDLFAYDASSCTPSALSSFSAVASNCSLLGPSVDAQAQTAFPALTATEWHRIARVGADLPGLQPVVSSDEVDNSGRFTYFASLAMRKSWREFVGTLSYRRSASASGGVSSTSVLDTTAAVITWRPSPLWFASFTTRWDLRSSTSDSLAVSSYRFGTGATVATGIASQPSLAIPAAVGVTGVNLERVKNPLDISSVTLALAVERKLSRRFDTFVRSSWYQQESKRAKRFGGTTKYDDMRIEVGVRYELAPIEVPFL
jgi:hypothetical protein